MSHSIISKPASGFWLLTDHSQHAYHSFWSLTACISQFLIAHSMHTTVFDCSQHACHSFWLLTACTPQFLIAHSMHATVFDRSCTVCIQQCLMVCCMCTESDQSNLEAENWGIGSRNSVLPSTYTPTTTFWWSVQEIIYLPSVASHQIFQ